MASFVAEFKHLEIQLDEIILATNNFDESKVIGGGGFGKVYAGELSHSQSGEKSLVAIKRLDRKYGQGDPEFFKEIRMLSCYRHENLISLLGFCCQGDEMILIYEYASCGSLDRYLSSSDLTWMQRLRICIDTAKGLSFLHDPNGTQQRVLHCDIKSANILLDKNMSAKVSDFGLSKMGPANQQYSLLITSAVGTPGYCDPLYMQMYSLTKESDVYSFGVVLFEVMCGRLCAENRNGRLIVYVPLWRKCYEENKLDEIILQDIRQQMDPSSLKTFSDIASQCLRNAREERPTMSRVVEELEIALESQEFPDLRLELLTKYEDIIMAVDPLLIYKTGNQLKELLSKGLIINEGKTCISITQKGERIKRIYIESCLNLDEIRVDRLQHPSADIVNSRFPGGRCYKYKYDFKACVRGQYLTPHISYMLNLVFRYKDQRDVNSYNPLRYKIDGEDETRVFIIYPSIHMREDGWFIVPLYQFTSQHETADLQFEFMGCLISLLFAGMEFQPSEENVELQEYQDIVEVASQSLCYTSLDELKQILSKGVHLNGYKTWFSLNEKGEHCHMISMEECLVPNEDFPSQYESHRWSRFPAGLYQTNNKGFKTHVKTQLLSQLITYTVNLVYRCHSFCKQVYVDLKYRLREETTTSVVYLANKRNDGLHMVELYQFTSDGSIVDLEIIFENSGTNIGGVEGIMFQPLEIVEDQVSKKDKVENIQTGSDSDSESDTYWEQKLPNDYEEMLKLSKDSLMWTTKKGLYSILRRGFLEILNLSKDSMQRTTKKELYSILRRGFLIDNGQQWFAVDKHGKKCLMLSARANCIIADKNSAYESSHESRFGEVLVITGDRELGIDIIEPQEVSPETTYAAYLVFKLPQDQSTFEAPMYVYDSYGQYESFIYLVSPPNTQVLGPKLDENRYNPLNRYTGNALPQQRTDGWMEVKLREFQTTTKSVRIFTRVRHPCENQLSGLMIQGIELRPI